MLRKFPFLLLAFVAGGCGSSRVGVLGPRDEATFQLRAGLQSRVERAEWVRPVAVGGRSGGEYGGPLGRATYAWDGDVLLAGRLVNASFAPPLPVAARAAGERRWEGTMHVGGAHRPATARMTADRERVRIDNRDQFVIRARTRIVRDGHTIELITDFEPRAGLLKQEQRTDGKLVVSLERLGS